MAERRRYPLWLSFTLLFILFLWVAYDFWFNFILPMVMDMTRRVGSPPTFLVFLMWVGVAVTMAFYTLIVYFLYVVGWLK